MWLIAIVCLVCFVVCCFALFCVVLCCLVLRCIVLCCAVLYCVVLCCVFVCLFVCLLVCLFVCLRVTELGSCTLASAAWHRERERWTDTKHVERHMYAHNCMARLATRTPPYMRNLQSQGSQGSQGSHLMGPDVFFILISALVLEGVQPLQGEANAGSCEE